MKKKLKKEDYIDIIMESKYADDDEKYRVNNLTFLESLTIDELKSMTDLNEIHGNYLEDEY